jgi:hypothetical protein
MTRYAKSHTQIDLAHRTIFLTFGLFFMMRYAPDSGFFLILQVNTRDRYREGGNISLKKISPPRGEGESKRKPKCVRKTAAGFPSACFS